jgi:hypothetical protein
MQNVIVNKNVWDGVLAGFVYDVFTFIAAFILVKVFYEKFYMKKRWGGWKIKVFHSKNDVFDGAERELSPQKAREILSDLGEFSVYVKGVVASTNSWLNTDIASKKAEEIGLVVRDDKTREIRIDIAKNPSKPKSVQFTQKTQEQIDAIEAMLCTLTKQNKYVEASNS